jgi:anti-anti-sigma factor
MEIKMSEEAGRVPVTLMEVNGRINLGSAGELEGKAREAHAAGARDLILDLSGSPSVTSAGLSAILAIYKLYNNVGPAASASGAESPKTRHLVLLNPTPEVHKVIKIAGFDRYLEIYTDRKEAVDSFG